jgi:hypothetical protein
MSAAVAEPIALENGRLHAELRANLDELHGSRARLIEAGQKSTPAAATRPCTPGPSSAWSRSRSTSACWKRGRAETRRQHRVAKASEKVAVSFAELRDVARGPHPRRC